MREFCEMEEEEKEEKDVDKKLGWSLEKWRRKWEYTLFLPYLMLTLPPPLRILEGRSRLVTFSGKE